MAAAEVGMAQAKSMHTDTTRRRTFPMRPSRSATPVPISIVNPTQARTKTTVCTIGGAEAAAGEQGAVIGQAVPDHLVADQLEDPEVLERGGEEPADRVTQHEAEEAESGQDQKEGQELAPQRAAPAGTYGAPTVGRRRRGAALRPTRAQFGHCRCGHVGYSALSRLSSFWSYCLAMVAML